MKKIGIAIIILVTFTFLISSSIPDFDSFSSAIQIFSITPQRFFDDLRMIEFLAKCTFSYDIHNHQYFTSGGGIASDGARYFTISMYESSPSSGHGVLIASYEYSTLDPNRDFLQNLTILEHDAFSDQSFWEIITTPFQLLAIGFNFLLSAFFGISYLIFDIISLPISFLEFLFSLGGG